MKKNYMFTPGPTMVPQEVLLAEASPMIHHRTAEFEAVHVEAHKGLQWLFGTEQPVYVVMGSGTAAMEASVVNVCSPGDRIITAPAGKFSERWSELGKAFGCEVIEIGLQWGQSLTAAKVAAALDDHPDARAVYATHSETSTGALTDVAAIAEVTRNTQTLFVIDAITTIGVHPVKMDEWGVDIVVSGSQKGCMMPPGLGFIAVSPRTWPTVEACTSPRYYLDLGAMKKNWAKQTTPFTGAVSLIQALRRAVQMMQAEGLDAIHARHERLAKAARAAVQAIGMTLVAEAPVNGVTAAYAPEGINTDQLVKLMRSKYGVQIAGGQEHLKGKIFRIGHMGYVSEEDMLVVIGVLEKGLRELGYEFESGAALRAAQEALA